MPSLYQAIPNLVNMTCLEWYLVDFDSSITAAEAEFIGFKSNTNITDASEGLGLFKNTVGTYDCVRQEEPLDEMVNPFQNRTMPFFRKSV